MSGSDASAVDAVQTIYLHCDALRHRGEVLNGFFYEHRHALGIDDWYELPSAPADNGATGEEGTPGGADGSAAVAPRMPFHAPVEVVHVVRSRKPYFLIEWRYPAAENKKNRHQALDEEPNQPMATDSSTPTVRQREGPFSEESLRAVTERLLALGKESSATPLVWKEKPVSISAALRGVTVTSEREKGRGSHAAPLASRNGEKRQREEHEPGNKPATLPPSETSTAATTLVPRCLRRRQG
ncbi:hypothetical protein NESM_000772900 [Novymonas esmeraldas]|uniref:Uncharacterized protein n=1 Tax=Novymonas esmeraldas TaxID=1808958 RepID=A0AAW0EYR4_9TRYP